MSRSLAAVPPLPRSLEVELGNPGVSPTFAGPHQVTGIDFVDNWEDVPELRWPSSVRVYDRTRKDAQVRSCLRAFLGPVVSQKRARWRLGREGSDPRVVRFLEVELGLTPEAEGRARRRRQGISWPRYCREAVTTRAWAGHAIFEQVYEIAGPAPGQEAENMPTMLAHLRKLAPRPPRTLAEPMLAPDGGLTGWKQNVSKVGKPWEMVELPLDRIVAHVREQEGADWRGQSALRPVWKHVAIRDVLMRVGAMAVERNGMGIPVVTYDENYPGVTRARALQLAKAVRAGDEAAVALPAGYELSVIGVAGQVRDELPLLKYHGEMIGRAFAAMVLDLGHDAGARSLGETFLQVLCETQNAEADEFAEEVTEYVIRDLVALNFGDDEPYPPLIHDELTPDTITWQDLAAFTQAGLIVPDDELEGELRRRAGMPLWPGAAQGDPGFDMGRTTEVPEGPGLDIPNTGPDLPDEAVELLRIFGYASRRTGAPPRSDADLEARLAAVQARMEGRRAAGLRRPVAPADAT